MPYERVRVAKRIVTETVTRTVELRREELVVEHRPWTPETPVAVSPSDVFNEREHEIVLYEERIEITKHVVPVERVRLIVSTTSEQRPVTGTLRRERVEITTGPPAENPR